LLGDCTPTSRRGRRTAHDGLNRRLGLASVGRVTYIVDAFTSTASPLARSPALDGDPDALKLLPHPKPAPARSSNDDNIGRGMEFALVTLVFLGMGVAIDSVAGTRPWFTISLVVFAFAGQFIKMYFTYTHQMTALEAERAAGARSRGRTGDASIASDPQGLGR
jgi:F0F1-type ATP synthase assembly protein I